MRDGRTTHQSTVVMPDLCAPFCPLSQKTYGFIFTKETQLSQSSSILPPNPVVHGIKPLGLRPEIRYTLDIYALS